MRKVSQRVFTIIELLVVIAIISILACLLFPALKNVNDLAKKTHCGNNLKQITLGASSYVPDNNDWFFNWYDTAGVKEYWNKTLFLCGYLPEPKTSRVYFCPGSSLRWRTTPSDEYYYSNYAYNGELGLWSPTWKDRRARQGQVDKPSATVLSSDSGYATATGCGQVMKAESLPLGDIYTTPGYAHTLRCNLVFVDGHVGDATPDTIAPVLWYSGTWHAGIGW